MADNEVYEVEKILEKVEIDGEVHYLIRWKGFDSDWDTWEPVDNLQDCLKLISDFEKNFLKTLKESAKNVSLGYISPSKQAIKNCESKTNKVEKLGKSSPKKNNEHFKESSQAESPKKTSSKQDCNLKITVDGWKKSPDKNSSAKSPRQTADKENVQSSQKEAARSVKRTIILDKQSSPKKSQSLKNSPNEIRNVKHSLANNVDTVQNSGNNIEGSAEKLRNTGDVQSHGERKKRKYVKKQKTEKDENIENASKLKRKLTVNSTLLKKSRVSASGKSKLKDKKDSKKLEGKKGSNTIKVKKKSVSLATLYKTKNNGVKKVPRFALKIKFKPNRKAEHRKVFTEKLDFSDHWEESKEKEKGTERKSESHDANGGKSNSASELSEKKIKTDKVEKDDSKAGKGRGKGRAKAEKDQSKVKKFDKVRSPKKRKIDDCITAELTDSDSDDNTTLYQIIEKTKNSKSSPKSKKSSSMSNSENNMKRTPPKIRSSLSVSNSDSRGKELTVEKVKRKLEVRVVPINCSSQKKKMRLIDSVRNKDHSHGNGTLVRAVSPIAFTNVRSMAAGGGGPSVISTTAAAGSSVASMDTLCGDVPSNVYNPSVIPVSPSSMSYKVLLDNLPHQLHPKKSNKKQEGDENSEYDDKIERRVSVRQSECAFRYKDIVVKKCHRYTQIWLNTRTKMKNALNPQVIQEVISALSSAKYDDSNLVMLSGLGNIFCSGIDLNYLISGDRKVVVRQMVDALREFIKVLINFQKPIVAAVTGSAIGLGMTLLPLCDIVYASDKATFYLPYTQLAQTPEACASYTLPQSLGMGMANELLISGRKLTAIEASNLGLVSQVFWPTSMMQEVIPKVQGLALCSAKALQTTKLLVRSHQRTKLEMTNESESNILLERWQSSECFKAMENFLSNENNYV